MTFDGKRTTAFRCNLFHKTLSRAHIDVWVGVAFLVLWILPLLLALVADDHGLCPFSSFVFGQLVARVFLPENYLIPPPAEARRF